jgi:hypothetical protein
MRKRPFSNGAEFVAWKARNCNRCALEWTPADGWSCEIERALDFAAMTGGKVDEEILVRMGQVNHANNLVWDCPERKEIT